MALRDYRLCDMCEGKVFYDEQLDYRFPTREDPIEPDERAKVCGLGGSYRLQYLGDWAVLCEDCAKTHKTIIVPIDGMPEPVAPSKAELVAELVAEMVAGLRRAEEARKQGIAALPPGTCPTCMGEGYLGSVESQRVTDCPDCVGGRIAGVKGDTNA